MNAALSSDVDAFIARALARVPNDSRDQALEIGVGAVSSTVGCCFKSMRLAEPGALAELPAAHFNFILASRAFDQMSSPAPVVGCFRESARLLRDGGLFCARLNSLDNSVTRFPTGELTDLARDLDFQVLVIEGAGSRSTSILWRKRTSGWRINLPDHAALASVRINRIANAWDNEPVVPSRGRYAAISILVEGLPTEVDLLDLEIFTGGVRATAISISEPDARGQQQINALLPSLEQTGLVPLELRWFGEPLTHSPAFVRVIPPGPTVPRVISVRAGSSRQAGITVLIEELGRPDEFSAAIDGVPVWGVETICVDPNTQSYDVHFQLPDGIAAGVHEIQMMAGRRKLPAVTVEIQ